MQRADAKQSQIGRFSTDKSMTGYVLWGKQRRKRAYLVIVRCGLLQIYINEAKFAAQFADYSDRDG